MSYPSPLHSPATPLPLSRAAANWYEFLSKPPSICSGRGPRSAPSSAANLSPEAPDCSDYFVKVIVEDNEPEERLLGRFRRVVMRAGIIQETKCRRYFENKQEEKKRRTRDAAKRNRRRPQSRFGSPKKSEDSRKKKNDDDEEKLGSP
ncbi:hypothetical protein CASFOL_018260 [Castilleja foliolosa]|uniref:Ribosomal protein S21 n=1 Tax=Castilleja foliolosa TaxID=1961234 RepID=A0ABD3D773_9LAMI